MRRTTRHLALAVVASLALGMFARAETLTITGQLTYNTDSTNGYSSSYPGEIGGEFRFYAFDTTALAAQNYKLADMGSALTNNSPGAVFQTFCVEPLENFTKDTKYYISINDKAVFDNKSGGFTPLASKTAYLFSRFWDGSLADLGYDYTLGTGRMNSAKALQIAIWDIQHGATPTIDDPTLAKTFYDAAFAATAGTAPLWSGTGNVHILNLWTDATQQDWNHRAQDQLVVLDSLSTPSAPVPASVWGGLALIGALAVSQVRARSRRDA